MRQGTTRSARVSYIRVKAVSALLLSLAACTPLRPQVSLAPGASLKGYHVVVVGPVTDRTGYPFGYDIGDSLKAELASELRQNGLTVAPATTDTAVPVLFIVSSLDGFKSGALTLRLPSAMGTSRCVFSSRLMDGHTGKQLGEMVSSELTDQEDTPALSPHALLATCVRMTAEELKRRLR